MEIHSKAYGFHLDKDFIVIMRNSLNLEDCKEGVCLDTECLKCAWQLDGVYSLPAMYENFHNTYIGDDITSVAFGIIISESEPYNSVTMKIVYGDSETPDDVVLNFNKCLKELPPHVQSAIEHAGLLPEIIYIVQ